MVRCNFFGGAGHSMIESRTAPPLNSGWMLNPWVGCRQRGPMVTVPEEDVLGNALLGGWVDERPEPFPLRHAAVFGPGVPPQVDLGALEA